jgi:hypothetical protein
VPKRSSKPESRRLIAGTETPSRFAAAENDPASTMATKVRIASNLSIVIVASPASELSSTYAQ